jgi:Tol biopolymer transport system component
VFLDLDGKVVDSIEKAGRFLFGAVWSSDGKWIAYSDTMSARFAADIFISRADGCDLWQVTDSTQNEINVEWGAAPD